MQQPQPQPQQPAEELKTVIEKAAAFVARLGDTFERKIFEKERANPKFAFLSPADPLHSYYRRRVDALRAEKDSAAAATAQSSAAVVSAPPQTRQLQPPPRDRFSAEQPNITAQEIDVIKLTALFVARNGQGFQVGLTNREQRNAQFDFLRPTDALHPYFAALVEQYRAVLLPPRAYEETLRAEYANPHAVLARLTDRADWETMQERVRRDAEAEERAEREAMARIDWQNFVVVETINLDDDEEEEDAKKQKPSQPSVATAAAAAPAPVDTNDVEMEIDDAGPPAPVPVAASAPAAPKQQPPKKAASGMTQICPKCKQQIPIEEFTEHMRIELLDPRYREQRQLAAERGATTALAPDEDIGRNLARFAKKRSDIFGSRETELAAIEQQKQREREERQRLNETVTWDGHSSSAPVFAAIQQQAQLKSQQIREEQIAQASAMMPALPSVPQPPAPAAPVAAPVPPLPTQQPVPAACLPAPISLLGLPILPPAGLLPVSVPEGPPGAAAPPAPSPPPPPQPAEEPPAKRARPEALVSEQEFLETHGGASARIRLSVQLPAVEDKPDWKHLGETLDLEHSLGDTVAAVKAAIHERSGIPPKKQKLAFGMHAVLKDASTLAHYNVLDGTQMIVKLRERGGKRK